MFKNKSILVTIALAFAIFIYSTSYAAIPSTIQGREYDKFVDISSNPAVRVTTTSVAPASVTYSDGRKVVASAGTAEALAATSTVFDNCDVQAEENNTGDIVIGGSTVVESPATRRGLLLIPGASYHLGTAGDLANVYIDSEVNGDGVHFFCRG